MTHWVMVIDLRKCIGCETCKQVCDGVNAVPPGATWRRLIDRETEGENHKKERVLLTMGCMHCSNPPCLKVCPTGATFRRGDGIVDINATLCLGCGACVLACPYKARSIVFEDKISPHNRCEALDMKSSETDRIGICTKCDFCRQRLENGLKKGLRPGLDAEATPVCVNYCIAEAISFGDLDDPESPVCMQIKENRTVRLQEELCTEPSVYYIPK